MSAFADFARVVDQFVPRESGSRGQPTLESPGSGQDGGSVHGFFDLLAQVGGDILPIVNAYTGSPASTPKPASAIDRPAPPARSWTSGPMLWVLAGGAVLLFLAFRKR